MNKQAIDTATTPVSSPSNRRSFLRRSVAGAALVAPLGVMAATQSVSAHAANALAPQQNRAFKPNMSLLSVSKSFHEIKRDENSHVAFLLEALGKAGVTPRPKPHFKNLYSAGVNQFAQYSRVFENVGVGAYLMAAPAISNKAYLAAAGSILTIEARHAGFLGSLLDDPLSSNGAFDVPLSQLQIVHDVAPFIASLNGGTDPSAPLKNDADILNFALLLEYLEAEFYNLNVPRFF